MPAHRKEKTAGEDGDDGKEPGEPFDTQAAFNVESRAAAVFAVDFFFIDLAECGFDESRRGAEECNHPHPEDGAGTAGDQCTCHADDITGTDGGGQCGTQRLELGDGLISGFGMFRYMFVVEDTADCVLEPVRYGITGKIMSARSSEYLSPPEAPAWEHPTRNR